MTSLAKWLLGMGWIALSFNSGNAFTLFKQDLHITTSWNCSIDNHNTSLSLVTVSSFTHLVAFSLYDLVWYLSKQVKQPAEYNSTNVYFLISCLTHFMYCSYEITYPLSLIISIGSYSRLVRSQSLWREDRSGQELHVCCYYFL